MSTTLEVPLYLCYTLVFSALELQIHGIVEYGVLNKNVHYWIIYLNVWSLVIGTVWEELAGVALLEVVCLSLGAGFVVSKAHEIPVGSLPPS